MTEEKQKIRRDGRLQLVLAAAFLYLSLSLLSHEIPVLSERHAVKKISYLRSVPPGRLMVESDRVHDNFIPLDAMPAGHSPFFFQPIPINSADKELLMTVKGIGPALADALLYYRQHFGPFGGIEDLLKISGVGAKRAASLSPFLLFDEVP